MANNDTSDPNAMKITETMASETVNKVLIDPSIPIEELLGSVTTYNTIDGSDVRSLQIRTSARVFKKMKLDLAAVPNVDKKEPDKKEDTKPEKKEDKEVKKQPLPRPLWTTEDKNLFFEALNEFGKDFDAIHLYICNKLKKKGVPGDQIKTREQIRHLYYRTWHKISKHLKFSDEVKKIVQELYGLINYGELRKKLTSISEKTCIKLNQLIYRGSLVVRIKGKTIRIKTPSCKALRRLNQLDENNDDIKLPSRIAVEIRPRDMTTWMKVQETSQNPRLKTVLPLQKRLSTLLVHLTERWKSHEVAEHAKLLSTAEQIETDEDKPIENIKPRLDPPLRILPPTDLTITVPTINLSEFFTTQSICLTSFEERTGVKNSGEKLWLQAYPNLVKSTTKRGLKRPRTESVTEKKPVASGSTDNNENCVMNGETGVSKEIIDDAVNTILALKESTQREIDEKNEAIKLEQELLMSVKKEHDIAKIKAGWSLNDCGSLTIGDMYLMFGSDSKVILEYCWDAPEEILIKKEENCSESLQIEEDKDCNLNESLSENCTDLSLTLRRLLSLAKLHYRKNMYKCPCGHVCNGINKNPGSRNKCGGKNQDGNKGASTSSLPTTAIITMPQNNISITTTASLVPVIIQREAESFSPTTIFRSPTDSGTFRAQLDSITRLKTKYCNRKGRRPRPKQVVVERKLSLIANKADNDRQIVTMNIISTEPRQIAPKIVPQITTSITSTITGTNGVYVESTLTPMSVTSDVTGTFGINQLSDEIASSSKVAPDILDNATTPSRVGSPTSISNLLDMAIQSHQRNGLSLEGQNKVASFEGILSDNNVSSISITGTTSPTRLLKENENPWLNSEVGDFSLSSFLGHLESPVKNTQGAGIANEDSRLGLSHDVDAQLQSLLTDSSMDLTAKFADLAAQVEENNKKQ